ncbi:MAG: rRNA pseudouridine synthase [Ruminococcaceae bacterium]|nr:rRNA pseudouridine synthase [Oscillospiraceae bacterium]
MTGLAKVRLDKYISSTLVISRKDAVSLIKSGRVSVNGNVKPKGDDKVDDSLDEVLFDGQKLTFAENIYIMLNKPRGLISATDGQGTVLSLFDKAFSDKGLFPCGRLDKDTVGLLIMTTDGALAHRLLSPKHHAEKTYYVECDKEFTQDDVTLMKEGIMMDGKKTQPAVLEILDDPKTAHITLTEGKYHEIKRLCYACRQKDVLFLKRLTFGGISLDESLSEGEWRELTDEELTILRQNQG